jgi:type VI secretion system secreted protein VgrG
VARGAQSDRQLTLATPLGADVLLPAALAGREAISQLFSYELDLVAPNDRQVPFEALLGQPVVLALALPTGGSRYFAGIVNRISQGSRGSKYTSYHAQVVPQLWLLTRSQTSRIFQQTSVPDILRRVLGGANVEFRLQGSFEARDYCVQYRETDFDFASRLMEEEGIYYFFEHGADGHRLVLGNSPQGHSQVPGAVTVAFDPSASGKAPSQAIFEWEKQQELRSGKVTLRDYHFELPRSNLEQQATTLDGVPVGQVTHRLKLDATANLELYDFPGGYAERFDGIDPGGGEQPGELQKVFPDGARTAAIRMEQEAAPSIRIDGAAAARQLVAGHRFTLQGHFNGDGPYVLTSVAHAAQVANVESGDIAYTSRFTCIPEALPFRPPRTTPRPVAGTQTAFVVGPAGQEIFTDKYGRVKVQFHWDREGKNDARSSCWVRVGAVYAGTPFGVIDIPRVGWEVVVAFEEGDPDQPIIVGSVYNADRLPPPVPPPPR